MNINKLLNMTRHRAICNRVNPGWTNIKKVIDLSDSHFLLYFPDPLRLDNSISSYNQVNIRGQGHNYMYMRTCTEGIDIAYKTINNLITNNENKLLDF
jgi:hypothetical protein